MYAVRKKCVKTIPNDIILEDLFLSLSILQNNNVVMCKECLLTDISFEKIYNYKRVKRYFSGLQQIAFNTTLLKELGLKKALMLLLHKYIRLYIPVMLVISVLFFLIIYFNDLKELFFSTYFIVILLLLTLILAFSKIRIIIKICLYYFIAFFELMFLKIIQILK